MKVILMLSMFSVFNGNPVSVTDTVINQYDTVEACKIASKQINKTKTKALIAIVDGKTTVLKRNKWAWCQST